MFNFETGMKWRVWLNPPPLFPLNRLGVFVLQDCSSGRLAVVCRPPWGDRGLPETYALCTPGGERKVYPVDVENRKVECLLVRGSFVVGSGDLETLKRVFNIPVLGFNTLKCE